MSGNRNNGQSATSSTNARKRVATNLQNHNDTIDFQQATLVALRNIQQDIVSSKNETMESQQQLTVQILQRVNHLEDASALQALTTENESNKSLIKHLQKELKAVNERQEEQDKTMGEMRATIDQLRNRNECSDTIKITVRTLTGKQIPIKIRSHDVVFVMKLKIRELEGIHVDQQRLVFQGRDLRDDKTLADFGVVSGSYVYLVLKLRGGAGMH